jgi:hypothetical protein
VVVSSSSASLLPTWGLKAPNFSRCPQRLFFEREKVKTVLEINECSSIKQRSFTKTVCEEYSTGDDSFRHSALFIEMAATLSTTAPNPNKDNL